MSGRVVCRVARGCTGCGTCVLECQAGAVKMTVRAGAEIDESKCVGCGRCLENCASEAIVKVQLQEEE